MIVFSRSVSDSSFRPRSRFPVQRPDYLAPRGLAFYREKGSDTRYFETWYLQFANYAQNCARNRGEKTEGKLSNPNSWTRITSSRSLYIPCNFHGKWKAYFSPIILAFDEKVTFAEIYVPPGDFPFEFAKREPLQGSGFPGFQRLHHSPAGGRAGVGRSRPMTRAIGHGSKVRPKRCDECHCTRPVPHRGSTCDAKRGGKKGRRKTEEDAVARERETKRDLIHRDACHSMSRVRFYG